METNRYTDKMIVSYLHARDPSIIVSKNCTKPCKLAKLMEESTVVQLEEFSEKKPNQIEVFLRIKNGTNNDKIYTCEENLLSIRMPDFSQHNKNLKAGTQMIKNYAFSEIFAGDTSQSSVFNNVVKERALSFINGCSNTLFAYGASGSGKTYTMLGTKNEPGVIPRTLEYLFKTLPTLSVVPKIKVLCNNSFKRVSEEEGRNERLQTSNLLKTTFIPVEKQTFTKTYRVMQKRLTNEPAAILDRFEGIDFGIWITFAEIYNEKIYDLLEHKAGKDRPILKLCNNNGETYIRNLKHLYVASALEAYQILQVGLTNINYATTGINSHSSRSHCVFTIKLVQASQLGDDVRISLFNFCDLAGAERMNKTNNVGKRLQESNNINTSLMVLSRCITTIRNSQKNCDKLRVPYRESKLTQLFQKALSGHEQIGIITNINPILAMIDETIHVLNFSVVAKDILIELPIEKEIQKIRRESFNLFSSANVARSTDKYPQQKSPEEYQKEISNLNIVIEDLFLNTEKLEEKIETMKTDHVNNVFTKISAIIEESNHEKSLLKKKLEQKDREIKKMQIKLQNAGLSPCISEESEESQDDSQLSEDEESRSEESCSDDSSSEDESNTEVSSTRKMFDVDDVICLDSSSEDL